jgi:hypothetical protein
MTSSTSSTSSGSSAPSRALCGWAPPDLPADTPVKRRIDRLLPRNGPGAFLFFGLVAVALSVAGSFPTRPYLGTVAAASALAGGWCAVNFWRCRHAHCVVSAVGWLGLAAFSAVEVVLGRSVIGGNEGLVFLGILGVALLFEVGVYAARGTNALAGDHPTESVDG